MLLGKRNQEGKQQDDGVEPAVEKRVNGIKRKQEKLKERQEFAKKKGNWHRSDSKQKLVMEEGSWRAQGRTSKDCRLTLNLKERSLPDHKSVLYTVTEQCLLVLLFCHPKPERAEPSRSKNRAVSNIAVG